MTAKVTEIDIRRNNRDAAMQGERQGYQSQWTLSQVRESHRPKDIHQAQTVGEVEVTTFETIGRRGAQEDTFVVKEARPGLPPHNVPQFLAESCEALNSLVTDANTPDGSTLNIVYVSADPQRTITVANAGDSRAVLLVRDTVTGEIAPQRLSYDHSPGDPRERPRIEATGHTVEPGIDGKYRVDGMLAVARGLGDNRFGPGVTHEPDVTQIPVGDILNDPTREVYVLQSCDGLYEKGMHEKDLVKLMQELLKKGPASPQLVAQLPHLFADAAAASGCTDNLTVHVIPITRSQTEDIIVATFDGHSLNGRGSKTSKLAAEGMREIADGKFVTPAMQSLYAEDEAVLQTVSRVDRLTSLIDQARVAAANNKKGDPFLNRQPDGSLIIISGDSEISALRSHLKGQGVTLQTESFGDQAKLIITNPSEGLLQAIAPEKAVTQAQWQHIPGGPTQHEQTFMLKGGLSPAILNQINETLKATGFHPDNPEYPAYLMLQDAEASQLWKAVRSKQTLPGQGKEGNSR